MSDLVKRDVSALPAAPSTNVEAPMSFSLGATAAIAAAALIIGFIVSERITMSMEAKEEEEGALETRRPRRRRKRRKS